MSFGRRQGGMGKGQPICPFQGGLGRRTEETGVGFATWATGVLNSQKHQGENGSGIWGLQSILFPCTRPRIQAQDCCLPCQQAEAPVGTASCGTLSPTLDWPHLLRAPRCLGQRVWFAQGRRHARTQTVPPSRPPAWRKLCSPTNVLYRPRDCSPQTVPSLAHTHTRATLAPSEHLGNHGTESQWRQFPRTFPCPLFGVQKDG